MKAPSASPHVFGRYCLFAFIFLLQAFPFSRAQTLAPYVTQQPRSTSVELGGTARFTVRAAGATPLTYIWRHEGRIISTSSTPDLVIANVEGRHAGSYFVLIKNQFGQVDSIDVFLEVTSSAPRITSEPTGGVIYKGTNYTLSVIAIGTPPLKYQWFLDRRPIPGATNTSVAIANAGETNSGHYHVEVTNLNGTSRSRAAEVIVAEPDVPGQYQTTTLAGSGEAAFADGVGINAAMLGNNGGSVGPNGEIYFPDTGNHRVRAVDQNGRVWTIAGTGEIGWKDGAVAEAKFYSPIGTFYDRRTGFLYVAESQNHLLRKIDLELGVVSTVAGNGQAGYRDGPGSSAQFNFPNDITVDSFGNVYVSEFSNHTVRKISPAGEVSTFAGNGTPGYVNGAGVDARFNGPAGLAIDEHDNLFVPEWNNSVIRKITPTGEVTTHAGSGRRGFTDGTLLTATFASPDGIAIDKLGNVFITENGNHAIRKINPLGTVRTLAGTGVKGFADGGPDQAQFNGPAGIAVLENGVLMVADSANHRVRRMQFYTPPRIVTQPVGSTNRIGETAVFQVEAVGEGPLRYQWYLFNYLLPKETNRVLNLPVINGAMWGSYFVEVSGPGGTVRSSGAYLDVEVPNRPPAIQITSPITGSSFSRLSPIPVSVTTYDPDASDAITRVLYFVNGEYFASSVAPPFGITFTPQEGGKYQLAAQANDGRGGSTLSAPVEINVGSLQKIDLYLSLSPNRAEVPLGTSITVMTTAVPNFSTAALYQVLVNSVVQESRTGLVGSYIATIYQPTTTGTHTFQTRAMAVDGTVSESPAVTIQVVKPAIPVVTRSMPTSFWPGREMIVELLVQTSLGTTYVVEEHPPVGWMVTGVSSNAMANAFDEQTSRVKWVVRNSLASMTLSYRLWAPPGAVRGSFVGQVNLGGDQDMIFGRALIQAFPSKIFPADMNSDSKIEIGEIARYVNTFSLGLTWPSEPKVITLAYAARGAYLYVSGEQYVLAGVNEPADFISFFTPPPANGVLVRMNVPEGGKSRIESSSAGAQKVTVEIVPPEKTLIYGAEELIPTGWDVSEVSDGGTFDPGSRRIRWLFFDGVARAIGYKITRSGAVQAGVVRGVINFDGEWEAEITGDRTVVAGALLEVRLAGGQTVIEVAGVAADQGWVLEGSSDLASWMNLVDGSGEGAAYTATEGEGRKFFRLRLK